MSKGPGKIQRAILELFELEPENMMDSIEIAARVFDQNPVGQSETVSTRRALRGLADRGLLVDMGRHWRFGRRRWATPDGAAAYRARVERTFGKTAI
jgi:hypothetical protein